MDNSNNSDGWVLLARLVRPQGRRGELLADIFTDFPQAFSSRKGIFLRAPGAEPSQPLRDTTIESHWLHKGRVVLKFASVDSITDADKLRGYEVVVRRQERMPLEDDAVYVSDLLGVSVIDVSLHGSGVVGEIVDVEPEGANPAMLVIRTSGGEERFIPFVRAFLRRVDLKARQLEMELPTGLLAMQAPATEQETLAALAEADDGEEAS